MSLAELVSTIVFYLFAIVSVVGALVAVGSNRILRSAVGLAVTLVCAAAFYILLGYDFIAGIQVLVYVGGIVVLIVFAIMLTSSLEWVEDHPTPIRLALAIFASVLFFVVTVAALIFTPFALSSSASPPGDIVRILGLMLLDTSGKGYVTPFELISILLLAAVIGGIVIARSYRSDQTTTDSGKNIS